MAVLKRILITLLILILLLVGVVAWLLSGIDINKYKPQLIELAQKQGIALQLDGDIGWQLWPDIGLELEGVQLAPLALPEQPLVKAERLAIGVALMPLLKKQVDAEEIVLVAPQIELAVNEQGKGNWEVLAEAIQAKQKADAQQPPQLDVPQQGTQAIDLSLNKLRIEDGRIRYTDAQAKTEYAVDQLQVTADNLVPGGEPGQISATAEVTGSALTEPVTLQINSSLAIDEGLNGLRLQPVEVTASAGDARAEFYLRGYVRRSKPEQPWQIQLNTNAKLEPLRPWLAVVGSELETQNANALQKLTLESNLEGTDKQLTFTPLQIQLDDTEFAGSAQFRNDNIPGIDLNLRGGALVLDDYLPPSTDETAAPAATADSTAAEQAADPAPAEQTADVSAENKAADKQAAEEKAAEAEAAEATPLPLTAMRGFRANIDLSLEKLTAADLQLDNPQLQLNVDNGLYRLQKLAAGLYGGQFSSNGTFNARAQSAVAALDGGLADVEISKVQEALFPSDKVKVSGQSSVNWTAQTRGADTAELQKQLRAVVQVSSKSMALAPFNLEKGMCQLVSYAEKTELPARDWPAQTRLQDLRVDLTVSGDEVKVEEILAGVENIAVTGDGEVDLDKGEFDFALGLALVGQQTSADGCTIRNERWRNRPLPLRCKDSFADAGATSCKPDSRRIDDVLREEIKHKAKKKYEGKVKEQVDKLKDRFKGLFGRDRKD